MFGPTRGASQSQGFFGNALKNFGVSDLLDGFAAFTGNIPTGTTRHARAARRRKRPAAQSRHSPR